MNLHEFVGIVRCGHNDQPEHNHISTASFDAKMREQHGCTNLRYVAIERDKAFVCTGNGPSVRAGIYEIDPAPLTTEEEVIGVIQMVCRLAR